jgi:hypothetical protein
MLIVIRVCVSNGYICMQRPWRGPDVFYTLFWGLGVPTEGKALLQ